MKHKLWTALKVVKWCKTKLPNIQNLYTKYNVNMNSKEYEPTRFWFLPLGVWTCGPFTEGRAISGISILERLPKDVWWAIFTFPLSKLLNEVSRDTAAILLGLHDLGDAKLDSVACLLGTGTSSIVSACLLPELCVLFILFSSASERSINIVKMLIWKNNCPELIF